MRTIRTPFVSLLVSLLAACSSAAVAMQPGPDDGPEDPPGGGGGGGGGGGQVSEDSPEIDAYIESLPRLAVAPAAVAAGARSADVREGDYSCAIQRLAETRQYDRVVAYAANSDALYPGAIVSADSIETGLFTQIVLPRAPATISVSLENLDGTKSAVVAAPSLSAYRNALSGILNAEVTGSTPANLYSEVEEVHSEQQLQMALGLQASWGLGVASLRSSFNWSNREVRSRYLVRYTQSYYTVDLDAPGTPSAMFAPSVGLADVRARMDSRRPPLYVSSVTYGRMVLFTFESQHSAEEMSAALEFAYTGGFDVSGDVSVTYKEMLSQSKITAFILGGNGGAAVESINSYDALIAFIATGGNYSRQSPGAPIAYKLSYLKDNAPARMSFATEYEIKECARVSQRVLVTLNSIIVDRVGGEGDALEVYGRIVVGEGVNGATLFRKTAEQYVSIDVGQPYGTGGTGGGPIAEAVIDVTPRPGEAIRLYADLAEVDDWSPDDDLGEETLWSAFEAGWRRDVTVRLTGDGAIIRVNFTMTPI